MAQFTKAHGGCAHFAHSHAGCGIGHIHAFFPGQTAAYADRLGSDNGVSRSRNIRHLPHHRRNVARRHIRREQGHSLGTAGYEQPFNGVVAAHSIRQLFARFAIKGHSGVPAANDIKLCPVRRDAVRARIALPLYALGVNQHLDAKAARLFYDKAA